MSAKLTTSAVEWCKVNASISLQCTTTPPNQDYLMPQDPNHVRAIIPRIHKMISSAEVTMYPAIILQKLYVYES